MKRSSSLLALALSALVALACDGAASGAAPCGQLDSADVLLRGDVLASCDQAFVVTMQPDGNLVVYRGEQVPENAVWATGTYNQDGYLAEMQEDGNFVLYTSSGTTPADALWSSKTYDNPGAYLRLENSGELAVMSDSAVLWQSTPGELDAAGSSGGGSSGGCTADADCGSCERCERSTGNCIARLSC